MDEKDIVFISYSHKDERWKDQLVTQLHALQQQALDVWDDRRIGAGEDWLKQIRAALRRARVAILLVTADFLSSNFITREEVPRILRRRQREGLRVIPIVVKSCPWRAVTWLAAMQLRPKDGKPLTRSRGAYANDDLSAIALEVHTLLDGDTARLALPATTRRTLPQSTVAQAGRTRDAAVAVRKVVPARKSVSTSPLTTTKKPSRPREQRSVSTSGSIVLLDRLPFMASSVQHDGRDVVIQIPISSSAQGSRLGQLQTKYGSGRQQLTYAYQDDAALVTLVSAASNSSGGKTTCTLHLRRVDDPDAATLAEYSMNGWSAQDIAHFRATRLLIGDATLPETVRRDQFVMAAIEGYAGAPIPKGPILPELWKEYGSNPMRFLQIAHLNAVLALKASRICEHIVKLVLGPITPAGVRVDFAGVRPQAYAGQEPATIAVKGVCPLPTRRKTIEL